MQVPHLVILLFELKPMFVYMCLLLYLCFQVKYHRNGPILGAETDLFDLQCKCYHLSVVFCQSTNNLKS